MSITSFETVPNLLANLTKSNTSNASQYLGRTPKKNACYEIICGTTSSCHSTISAHDIRASATKILLPSAVHLEERLTISQSVT